MRSETICAISTAPGGAIGIIRVSGSDSISLVDQIFKSATGKKLEFCKGFTAHYGEIYNKDRVLDQVIVTIFRAPHSYTGEDLVEISCHGSTYILQSIINELLDSSPHIRLATAGEFTKRAFLNGRIDLSQAEAVMDIITAKTDLAMKSALMQSNGYLSREINKLREYMLNILALVEFAVDFTEDDEEIDPSIPLKVAESLEKSINEMNSLLKSADEGKLIREGLSLAIVGKPNVGKSSLLNALLRQKRAIVTDIAGTTRDIIEEYINLDGIPVKIIDTAGIRETEDIVEKIGVERSREKIQEADLVLLVLDSSRELDDEDKEIIDSVGDKKCVVILNKIDLESKIDENIISNFDNIIKISAKEEIGLGDLKNTIKDLFFSGKIDTESLIISNSRHKQALFRALENAEMALSKVRMNEYLDLISIFVTSALRALNEITGDELEEDLVNKIFGDFCVGK